MTRLVQIRNGSQRRVARVEGKHLRLLDGDASIHGLAQQALASQGDLTALVERLASATELEYEPVHRGASDWRLMTPIDHPEPSRCLVSGTGLTHLGSAQDRQSMHARAEQELTDSMKMFRWGLEGGRPAAGAVGVAPEWFYKGSGTTLRAHGEALLVPEFAEDGGEEGEVAGVYLIDPGGQPYRLGMAMGNEFSDHAFERKNYLNLAGSKLRTCALGPELVVGGAFRSVPGRVTIERGGAELWSKEVCTGEEAMCHSLQNIEHHHFKFEAHRRPGDVHVHFFGAHSLSFGDGVKLVDGDVMQVAFEGFGLPLRNPVRVAPPAQALSSVRPCI
jgi:hypothetical protein